MSGVQIGNSFDLYKFLIANNGKIVNNIPFPWSPGHMTHDIDNFLRMRYLGEIDSKALCILPFLEGPIPHTVAQIYGHLFTPQTRNIFIVNNAITAMAREIGLAMPELTIDVGLSHSKLALEDRANCRLSPFQGGLHFAVTNHRAWRDFTRWMERRSRSMEYQPLSTGPEPDNNLRRFLNDDWSKLALIHRRDVAGNSAVPSPVAQFFPTLSYLRDNGYKMVFVSRERCPEEFSYYGVLNYSQSPVASFYNDLALFKVAKLAILSGAGIGHMAQMFNTPLVWTNYWMLLGHFTSRCTVWLPAMLRYKENGHLLKFIEQFYLLWNRPEGWDIPPDQFSGPHGGNPGTFGYGFDDYELRVPEPDELLASVKEVEALVQNWTPPTPLQARFNKLDPESGTQYLEGRVSRYLVEKFPGALLPGFSG